MGAPVAAIIVRREKDLVEKFRQARATSPDHTTTPEALGVHRRLAWDILVRRAVIREATDGRWYLDEPSWEALRGMRRRFALVMLVVLLFGLLTAWFTSRK